MSEVAVRGVGLGLRSGLARDVLNRPPAALAWLEISPENYLRRGGRARATLDACRARFTIVTHGLGLSLGGAEPLDRAYLDDLARFTREVRAPWHGEHLCFSRAGGATLHELLPVPFTRRMARHVADRVRRARDALDLPIAVENVSYYALPPGSELGEGEFATEVVRAAGCGLLLDVNNVWVNAKNHGHDPRGAIDAMPLDAVVQLHVAGHDASDPRLVVDTHAAAVREEVFDLLAYALSLTGPRPVSIERDDACPPWEDLCDELGVVDELLRRAARGTP